MLQKMRKWSLAIPLFILLLGLLISQVLPIFFGAKDYFCQEELQDYLGQTTIQDILNRHSENPIKLTGIIEKDTERFYVEVIFQNTEYRLSGANSSAKQLSFYQNYLAAKMYGQNLAPYLQGCALAETDYEVPLEIVNFNTCEEQADGPRGLLVGDIEAKIRTAFPDLSKRYTLQDYERELGITERLYGLEDMKEYRGLHNQSYPLAGGFCYDASYGNQTQSIYQFSFLTGQTPEGKTEYGFVFFFCSEGRIKSIAAGYYAE